MNQDTHGMISQDKNFHFRHRLKPEGPEWHSTGFKWIEKINATAPQPQRNVLKYFAIFKNVAHSLEPGETPSYSASHKAPNYVQRS